MIIVVVYCCWKNLKDDTEVKEKDDVDDDDDDDVDSDNDDDDGDSDADTCRACDKPLTSHADSLQCTSRCNAAYHRGCVDQEVPVDKTFECSECAAGNCREILKNCLFTGLSLSGISGNREMSGNSGEGPKFVKSPGKVGEFVQSGKFLLWQLNKVTYFIRTVIHFSYVMFTENLD